MKLLSLSLAWVIGVYLGSKVTPHPLAIGFAFILPPLLILFWHKKQACLWGGLCLIVFLGGLLRFPYANTGPDLQLYNDQGIVEIRGTVGRDPEFEGRTAKICLSAQEIKVDGRREEVSGDVLIYAKSLPSYSYGDQLQVTGDLRTPPQLEDFDYRAYLARQGIYSIMLYPQIELLGREWFFSLRGRLAQSLAYALPEPQGSLAQALLLGIRSHIPDSLMDAFRTTGTAHLIAISGLHVAILGGIVLSIGAWLFGRHRPIYILLAFGAIWLYALLAGMRPPAFRAAIMFSLFLIALWLGRPRSAMPSLALAAAIMVGITPQILWDVSFQLSFVAVTGIVLLLPALQSSGREVMGGRTGSLASVANPVLDSFAITLAAIIATYPLIAYYFGYVSFVGLPATFLALPALPAVIVTITLVAILGLFAPVLSWIMGWAAWLFLSYLMKVVEGFAALPFASHQVGSIDGAWVWACYGVLAAALWVVSSRKHLRHGHI
jgi:competence protein ComEC